MGNFLLCKQKNRKYPAVGVDSQAGGGVKENGPTTLVSAVIVEPNGRDNIVVDGLLGMSSYPS
jgi:hypothetical protein